ncbi:two-component system regulatory protein YycI [Ligilactobacillus cholophilus]|uniref:two-component system regulatory protein YycI n=1 Tax=Ligilactobacillus cholophilus TaxID=3050131 RepID=UPI0025B08DBD|nr:two-component system regulatory protein YycI [Ligilactobacillus cholophilus]
MNFRRIEWIFFIAFIILDIFLVSSYFRQGPIPNANSKGTENTTVSVLKSMRDDQINVGKVSNKKDNGYYISSSDGNHLKEKGNSLRYQNWSYNNNQINSTFATMIKVNADNPQRSLKSIVNDPSQIIDGKDYKYCKKLSTKNVIVYAQYIHGDPVYDSSGQIRFHVKNGYIEGYTQGHLENIQTLRGSRKIISQKRALIWLYQYNKLPSNSTVESSNLTYSKLLSVNGNTIYIPTWVFYIKNNASGSTIYRKINAFTGAVMDDGNN